MISWLNGDAALLEKHYGFVRYGFIGELCNQFSETAAIHVPL